MTAQDRKCFKTLTGDMPPKANKGQSLYFTTADREQARSIVDLLECLQVEYVRTTKKDSDDDYITS